jgi:hypothetical protein
MTKLILALTALASLTIANAKAQYYNFDVTVHHDDPNETLQILRQETQEIEQQNIRQFCNQWVYTFNKVQKAAYLNAVPGLRSALAHNDWTAAYSFFWNYQDQAAAYIKKYHAIPACFFSCC